MGYQLVHKLDEQQVLDLCEMYQSQWWTKERTMDDIIKMLGHSLPFALANDSNHRLVGFARVLTDYVYKALILDVIAHHDYRNTGIGKCLMNSIIEHPTLSRVRHFELYCRPEMIPFYQKWGFTREVGELHFMRRV